MNRIKPEFLAVRHHGVLPEDRYIELLREENIPKYRFRMPFHLLFYAVNVFFFGNGGSFLLGVDRTRGEFKEALL